jgi:hypothetical protein
MSATNHLTARTLNKLLFMTLCVATEEAAASEARRARSGSCRWRRARERDPWYEMRCVDVKCRKAVGACGAEAKTIRDARKAGGGIQGRPTRDGVGWRSRNAGEKTAEEHAYKCEPRKQTDKSSRSRAGAWQGGPQMIIAEKDGQAWSGRGRGGRQLHQPRGAQKDGLPPESERRSGNRWLQEENAASEHMRVQDKKGWTRVALCSCFPTSLNCGRAFADARTRMTCLIHLVE